MKDIIEAENGKDLNIIDSIVAKAGNVIAVQLGALEYAQDFGVDLRFFLQSEFQFQNDSFKSYLVQRLTENQVNVAEVIDTLDTLFEKYTFLVGSDNTQSNNGGLIL